MKVVAVDQGTTSSRGVLFEDGAAPQIVKTVRHQTTYPDLGWVEQEPLELLANVEACIDAAGPVDAIALANQGESCLAWDRISGAPLSPVIVWQDSRTSKRTEALKETGFDRITTSLAGLPLDPYFSASKLAWILENNDAAKAAHKAGRLRLGTSDSFFLRHLTGIDATDASTASRTSLMNLSTLRWESALCEGFGVPMDALAPIRFTVGDFGRRAGTPVKVSIVDQQAALFGHGRRTAGEAKVTFGTGAFALALVDRLPPLTTLGGLSATVAWWSGEGVSYALEAGVYDAGAALEWGTKIGVVSSLDDLTALQGPPAIERGLVFVPALSGLAAPVWDRAARGLWTGMTIATDRADMQRSLLEGVALQTREVIEAIGERIPLGDTISVDGGLTAAPYFLQFLADVLGMKISKPHFKELTAVGCAALAGFDIDDSKTFAIAFHPTTGSEWRRADYIAQYRAALFKAADCAGPVI